MKKNDLITKISNKLQNSDNLFKGYFKGSIGLRTLCDNIALRVVTEIAEDIKDLENDE